MTVALGLAARMGGVQVWDWSDQKTRDRAIRLYPMLGSLELAYDEIYTSLRSSSFIVGSLDHFLWRMLQMACNEECRDAAEAHIKREAERILGEPYELLPREVAYRSARG